MASFALIKELYEKTDKNGNGYLDMIVIGSDKNEYPAKVWRFENNGQFEKNSVVEIEYTVDNYKGKQQLNITSIKKAPDEMISEFVPTSEYDGKSVFAMLLKEETNKYLNYCKFQKELEKKMHEKESKLNEISNARMKGIDINDKNRVKVIKWLKNFYDSFEKVNTLKGLYLHGSFGSGKTYLIAALLNELEKNKDASIEIVYFPEVLRNMKEDFSLAQDKVNYYQNVDILLIDDIGAEKVTEWGRDEILGTILQYRMNNKLTTFFTSNLTIEELENHLATTKNSEDKVKARRIIERIKQLTEDMELVSINRRN